MGEKWELVEFTSEERNKRRLNGETHYKIYERDQSTEFGSYESIQKSQKSLFNFFAKNDNEAFEVLKAWKIDHQDGKEYLFTARGLYEDPDGNCYDSFFDMMNARQKNFKTRFSDFLYDAQYWLYEYWLCKFNSFKCFVKDVLFYIVHYDFEQKISYSRHDFWSLDYAVMRNILFQTELLKKHGQTYPNRYCPKVNCMKEENENACKAWHEDISKFQDCIVAYLYYDSYGIMCETDEHYEKMKKLLDDKIVEIKYVPGTETVDYKYIAEQQNYWWKKTWEEWEKIGRELWE